MTLYNLPAETARLLNSFFQSRHPQNLGLLLDKYVPAGVIDKEKAPDKRKDERGNWLRDIVQHYQIDTKLASAASHRWESYTSALGATRFSADLDWRMVIGLGGNGILETDLTLHHLYGLPIIPGSALKGLARTYAATEDEEVYIAGSDGQFRPSAKIETDHTTIQRIFGMQDKAGTVIFFDAFPKDGQATIALDIMNPHYPNYYQQKEVAPTNDQNPVPIVFLAIERTSYRFALALRQGAEGQKDDLTAACLWLQKALQHYGIGGKTSAGYGYFQKPADIATPANSSQTGVGNHLRAEGNIPQPTVRDPDMQRAESAKHSLEALKESDVAGQINGYYQQWQQLKSADARELLAQAIVDTVSRAKREKASAEKAWYKDLVAFLKKSRE